MVCGFSFMWSALDDCKGKGQGSAFLRDADQDFSKLDIKRSFFVPDLHDCHSRPAAGAVEGVIAEGGGDGRPDQVAADVLHGMGTGAGRGDNVRYALY